MSGDGVRLCYSIFSKDVRYLTPETLRAMTNPLTYRPQDLIQHLCIVQVSNLRVDDYQPMRVDEQSRNISR